MKGLRIRVGQSVTYLRDGWQFVRMHPYLTVGIALGVTLLASGDLAQIISGLSSIAFTPAFHIYHELHNFLAIALGFYMAYRWLPKPGISALLLFALAHIPYIILFPKDMAEYVDLAVFIVVGIIASLLIAERRRSTDLITARELEMRAQFNASPIGISIAQDGKFRYVNPQLQLYTGYTQEQLVGLDATWLIVPEDRDRVTQNMVKMLKGEYHVSPCEFRTVTRSGDTRWVLGTVTSISYRGRSATLGNFLDITERRRAEETIKELALFAELSPAPLIRFDCNGTVTFANSVARSILGRVADGAWVTTLFPSLRDIDLSRCVREGALIQREAMAGGRCFQLTIQGVPQLGIGHIYASDISVRRDAEEQFTRTIRTAMDGFLLTDWDGNLLDVNEAYCRLSGYSRELLLRMNVRDLEAQENRETAARHIQRIVENGRDQFETRHRNKDGETIAVEVSATSAGPGSQRLFIFIHNVTHRKSMEADLRHLARRLVDVQEEERRTLARELHDQIGQYITALKITLDMVKNLSGAKAEAKLAEAKQILDELMNEVRSLSLQLRPSMLDDLGLLPALLWHFERYTSQTGVRVNFSHSLLDVPVPVSVGTAAYRIIQEALTNVARYSGVKEVAVKVVASDGCLQLEIRDRGAGFDSKKVMASGSCFGINGMRERAVALAGKATIDSAPGLGTTVKADLPLASQPAVRFPERELHSQSAPASR